MNWARLLQLGFLAFLADSLCGQVMDPLAQVELQPSAATVGDRVEAHITLAIPAEEATHATFPSWGDRWGPVEIVEVGPVESRMEGPRLLLSQRLVLVSFEPGHHLLPPVEISWGRNSERRTQTPEGTALIIRSVLPEGEAAPPPAPPEPPVELPVPAAAWFAIGALGVANAVAAVWLWRQRRSLSGTLAALLPPADEFEQALAELDGSNPREGNAALSRAFRRYLGRTLEIPAVESTTRELDQRLRAEATPSDWVFQLVRLLRDCDRAKFGPDSGTADELASRVVTARELARQLEQLKKAQEAVGSPMETQDS